MLSERDRVAIDDLRERLRKSIVAGDADAYATCFAEDGVVMHPDSEPVRGRDTLREYVAGMFETVQIPLLQFSPVTVDGAGDLAYEVSLQECDMEPPLPGFSRERQHLHVYRRGEDGAWYVAAAMSGNR